MIRAELQKLARHSAIYGLADVVPYLINFLLLPVFTSFLAPADYGALGILLLFGVLAKIFFRSGLDAAFFRIYYEQKTDHSRRVLATTLFAASFAISTLLFAVCVLGAGALGRVLLGGEFVLSNVSLWVTLVAFDTLLNSFAFVPMNLFRIQGKSRSFTVMTLFRSGVNIALKLTLVLMGWGVAGVLWADVAASLLFVVALAPTLMKNLAMGFSGAMLKEAFHFGLPKVPHGIAHQVLNLSDRKLIEMFLELSATGLYHIGYMMGTGAKFFLSAFELAWAPFVYAQASEKQASAQQTLARMATYAFAVLAGCGVLNAVFGRELLFVMAKPEFHPAHTVIPVIVLAYMMQGLFALTSIGIGISKKTTYFPVITISAALMNVVLNILWIPRFGVIGAAWATVVGYGVMALLGFWFGNKHYPIPFEWGRLMRIAIAATMAYFLSTLAPVELMRAVPIKLGASLAFPGALYAFGFFRKDELQWLTEQIDRWRGR